MFVPEKIPFSLKLWKFSWMIKHTEHSLHVPTWLVLIVGQISRGDHRDVNIIVSVIDEINESRRLKSLNSFANATEEDGAYSALKSQKAVSD